MQFNLEQYAKNEKKGLECLRAGDYKDARYYLLTSARYLLEAAKKSETSLKKIRWEKGLRLKDMALSIDLDKGPPQSKEPGDNKTKENGLTTEDKWFVSEKPNIRFDQIAGLNEVKETIRLRVLYPFHHPGAADRFKKKAGGGILLYGPPGTGKTMIAKAIAAELAAHFFNVKCSTIMSQWVGVSEQNIAKLFDLARQYPISVIFFDETEALVGKRGGRSTVMNRVIPEFLSQVDGLESNKNTILLLGATNRPWDMDEAALRTGRFGEKFYVGLPDIDAREQILHIELDGIPIEPGIDFREFAGLLDGYSGADIVGVCRKATDYPFQRQIRSGADTILTKSDLNRAIQEVLPSTDTRMLEKYRQFTKKR
jgi:SpoVK/Ycf46/Vps4 family AAA+-type ATPase